MDRPIGYLIHISNLKSKSIIHQLCLLVLVPSAFDMVGTALAKVFSVCKPTVPLMKKRANKTRMI